MNPLQVRPFDTSSAGNLPIETNPGLNPNRDLDAAAADFEAALKSDGEPIQLSTQKAMKAIAGNAMDGILKAKNPAEAITIMDNAMKELTATVNQAIASDPGASTVLIIAQAESQIAMVNAYNVKFPPYPNTNFASQTNN